MMKRNCFLKLVISMFLVILLVVTQLGCGDKPKKEETEAVKETKEANYRKALMRVI